MQSRLQTMRDSPMWDVTNSAAAGGILYSWYAGIDWPQLAAFLAAIYGAVILAEKALSIFGKARKWWRERP